MNQRKQVFKHSSPILVSFSPLKTLFGGGCSSRCTHYTLMDVGVCCHRLPLPGCMAAGSQVCCYLTGLKLYLLSTAHASKAPDNNEETGSLCPAPTPYFYDSLPIPL